jgi:DHA2 family multidrug resistance protein
MLTMPLVGRLVGRVDVRYLVVFGLAISALGLLAMTRFDLSVDFWTLASYRILQAAGLGFLFIPINAAAYATVPREKNNSAAAIINLSRNLGGSIGISVLTTIIAQRAQYHQSMLVESLSPYSQPYLDSLHMLQGRMMGQGGTAAEALQKAQALIAVNLDQQAQLLSYLDDFLLLALIFLALIPFVFLMRRPRYGAAPVPIE